MFRLYTKPVGKAIDFNPDETDEAPPELTITGIASTTNRDLDGDVISDDALKSLCEQAVGLNLHLEHDPTTDGIIGTISNAEIKGNELWITANILPDYAENLRSKLDFGINYGFSIDGFSTEGRTGLIKSFNLLEISLVAIPANWDSFSTVRAAKGVTSGGCLNSICKSIIKNNEVKKMADEKEDMRQEEEKKAEETPVFSPEQEDYIINLINQAFTEKEQSYIDEITDKVTSNIQTAEESKSADDEKEDDPEQEDNANDDTSDDNNNNDDKELDKAEEDDKEPDELDDEDKIEKGIKKYFDGMLKKSKYGKLNEYEEDNNTRTTKSTFLNSDERDMYGRNKRFL